MDDFIEAQDRALVDRFRYSSTWCGALTEGPCT